MSLSLTANLHKPSPSFRTQTCSKLKLQSSLFGIGRPNATAQFFGRVNKSLQLRTRNQKPTRAVIKMMPIGTPKVPYRNSAEGSWQWVDIYNALYRERIIFLGDNIDEEFSNQVLATMLYLDTLDNSKLMNFYISGPGGDLTPCLAIYDTMQSLQSPIGTINIGLAHGMIGFILAAGEKGKRAAMSLSRVTLLPPAGAARGRADNIHNEANELVRIRDYLFSELAKKTGHPLDKIHEDLKRVKHFDAEESLAYGLVDRIVRPPPVDADRPKSIPSLFK